MSKSVRIDLANSPHVPLFVPFIEALADHGIKVTVTTRDYAQAIPLLEKLEISHKVIGKHFVKKILKIIGLFVTFPINRTV